MSSNKYKILVVEDEANIRSFVETSLEAGGYQVFTAATPAARGADVFLPTVRI